MMTDAQYQAAADEAVNAARAGVARLVEDSDAIRPLVPHAEPDWPAFLANAEEVLADLGRLVAAHARGEINHGALVLTSRQVASKSEQIADALWLKFFDVEDC